MALVNLDDVASRLGRPISDPDEVDQVIAWTGDVEAIIRARIPDIDQRIVEGEPSAEVVTMVAANAVVRKVNNPTGKQNERIDDYSYGLTEDAARGELFLTDDEWALLMPDSGLGAFSVRPSYEPDRHPWSGL
ncbi:MAG TPA: Gp19/Gp15/Gp42 family protein [Jiangellaceae bacterium]|nr:Gp19/Gp15/Gp42 family protein [Jiangellaceae bacterium]